MKVIDSFLAAPTPEQRAAEAAKLHAFQAGAERDLAAAGYDTARSKELDLKFGANKSLSDLLSDPALYDPIKAQGIAVGGGLDAADTNQILLTRQAITPGIQLQQMDPLAYAQFGKAGDTFTGFREDQNRLDTDSRRDYGAKIYDVDQREAGADRRFSVETSPGARTDLAPNNPLGVRTLQGNPTVDTTKAGIAQQWLADGGDISAPLSPLTPVGAAFGTKQPDSGMSFSVGPDGTVEFQQGGGLTKTNVTNNQAAAASIESFLRTTSELRSVAATDPTLFGATGNIRRLAQGVVGQIDALGGAGDFDTTYEAAATELAQAGIRDPRLFDPNLTDVEKLATLSAYKAAAALADQEGRGLSNQDFDRFREVIGDPTAWLSNQKSFMAGLNRMERLALAELNATRSRLGLPPVDRSSIGSAPAAGNSAAPQVPQGLSGRDLLWSPSRKLFRDSVTGELFNAAGQKVQ